MIKYDVHVHVSLDKGNKIGGEDLISADQMIESMDERGIDVSVIMTTSSDNSFSSNNEALKIINKYPNRFKYMASIDINQKFDGILSDLKKQKTLGAIGVGELVVNKSIDDKDIQSLFKACEIENMPVLFHMSPGFGGSYYGIYDEPLLPMLDETLEKFKDLIIIGHSQPFWFELFNNRVSVSKEERNSYPEIESNEEGSLFTLMRKHKNLYADLSANSASNALRKHKLGINFINEFSDRLLFGSDIYNFNQYFPMQDYLKELLSDGKISTEVYEKIFSKNFEKIFENSIEKL